jgi:hypothetical protein
MTDNLQSKLPYSLLEMAGCCGRKTKHLLNNLMSFEGVRYLDVGTSEGSSVCAALYGNKCDVTLVDNYENRAARDLNIGTWAPLADVTVIDKDPFRVNVTKDLKKYNVYMYDGPDHSNLGHYRAIQHYYRALDDVFVLLIDDWNWPDVRTSTMNAIKGMRLNKLFEKEIITGGQSTPDWWNGLYVAVLEKAK